MRRRHKVFAAFMCFGLLGPAAASATDELATVSLAGHTFYIPRAYVFSLPNPPVSYLRIVAKLPCLAPLTPKEMDEYLQSKHGADHFLSASLNPFSDNPYVVGKAWVQSLLDQEHGFVAVLKREHPDDPQIAYDTRPKPIPGTKFTTFVSMAFDVFSSDANDPLVVYCDRNIGVCTVQEKALDTVHLWYWYERSAINGQIDNAATIDDNLKRLLASFLTPNPVKPGETSCN